MWLVRYAFEGSRDFRLWVSASRAVSPRRRESVYPLRGENCGSDRFLCSVAKSRPLVDELLGSLSLAPRRSRNRRRTRHTSGVSPRQWVFPDLSSAGDMNWRATRTYDLWGRTSSSQLGAGHTPGKAQTLH